MLFYRGWLFVVAATVCGCTSTSTTNTARTSTEQLLVSNAIDGALDKVNFTPFAGSKVYLEEKYLEGVDGKYLVASVRHRALHAGARLVDKAEDADLVVELRSGGIGTASSDAFIGTPSIGLPGMLTIPEVKLVERKQQQGSAKIGMVAYDAKSREILGGGGVALNQADDSNWFIVGVGPWQSGTVKDEVEVRTTGPSAVKRQVLPAAIAFQGVDRGRPIDAPPGQPAPGEDVRYASFPQDGAPPDATLANSVAGGVALQSYALVVCKRIDQHSERRLVSNPNSRHSPLATEPRLRDATRMPALVPTPLEVLCEDGPVLAVNKPAGIVVQGAPAGLENLADLVRDYLRMKYAKPGNVYLGVPHRLDRPVTGVVIFSRNSKCAARLSEQFAERSVRKTYRAIVERPPTPASGTLTDWLLRSGGGDEGAAEDSPHGPKVCVVPEGTPQAKQAVLHYRTLAVSRGRALVEIELETGRMHQIRIQFASRGWPIVGDTQYWATTAWDGDELRPATAADHDRYHPIALHAWRLTLQHPVRYDELTITAPQPVSWCRIGLMAADV